MSTQVTSRALLRLGWVVAVFYLVFGLVIGLLPSHWDEASLTDQVFYIVFVVGGGVLLAVGLRVFEQAAWPGAALVSVGAVAGAVPLFWTLLLPLFAIALLVLSVRDARRAQPARNETRTR